MCIRDRGQDVPADGQQPLPEAYPPHLLRRAADHIPPVAYDFHYRAAHVLRPAQLRAAYVSVTHEDEALSRRTVDAVQPVSYTHLDNIHDKQRDEGQHSKQHKDI